LEAYKQEVVELAQKFANNFEKYRDSVSEEVANAGPCV